MAPPMETFPASELPSHLQTVHKGFQPKRRKGKPLDAFTCPLYELEQYACMPEAKGRIKCNTILRLFRRCADGVTVETTALDREKRYMSAESK